MTNEKRSAMTRSKLSFRTQMLLVCVLCLGVLCIGVVLLNTFLIARLKDQMQ
jgi:hypothetical protein